MEGGGRDSNCLWRINISARVLERAFWKATDKMMALGLWPRWICLSLMGSQPGPLNLPRCWIKPCCNDCDWSGPEAVPLADDGTLSKQPGLRESSVSQGFLSTHPGALTGSQRWVFDTLKTIPNNGCSLHSLAFGCQRHAASVAWIRGC